MSEPDDPVDEPEDRKNLDDYLDDVLDEARTRELEEELRSDADLRVYFVRYARLHTDLQLEVRARLSGERALRRIEQIANAPAASGSPVAVGRVLASVMAAAVVLMALGWVWWLFTGAQKVTVAWLVNAQNCRWSGGADSARDLLAGGALKLESGLAEIRFECGATVILDGPADLELLSEKGVRLKKGKLTARVPPTVTGFEVLSPQGKVIDLGTEFAVAVAGDGSTDVFVFEGKVEAHPGDGGRTGDGVRLTRHQTARIADGRLTVDPVESRPDARQFVRTIVPAPVLKPRWLRLLFDRSDGVGILDVDGRGTGFTHRLPGTGRDLPGRDPNLRVRPEQPHLELTSTRSDIRRQRRLPTGEYLGVRLSDLGFTGPEDFSVSATLPDIPLLVKYGQFGLYAGTRSDRNIRGGLIKWGEKDPGRNTQFLVKNYDGEDQALNKIGLLSAGTDLRLTLERRGGKYSLTVENLTDGGTSRLTIRHADFLDGEPDLFVGLFGANPYTDEQKTLVVQELSVTVWTASD